MNSQNDIKAEGAQVTTESGSSSDSAERQTGDFARRTRRYKSRLGDDPHLVSFPFAFKVCMLILAGFTLVAWGITVLSVKLFVWGAFLTLLGCLVYGWSLIAEDL